MRRVEVSNINLGIAVKRFLGLKGQPQLVPTSDLVPVLVAGDVSEAPYGARRRFSLMVAITANAGQRGFAGICNQSTTQTVVLEEFILSSNVNQNYYVYLVNTVIAGTVAALTSLEVGTAFGADNDAPIGVYGLDAPPAPTGTAPVALHRPLATANEEARRARIILPPRTSVVFAPQNNASTMYYNLLGYIDQL